MSKRDELIERMADAGWQVTYTNALPEPGRNMRGNDARAQMSAALDAILSADHAVLAAVGLVRVATSGSPWLNPAAGLGEATAADLIKEAVAICRREADAIEDAHRLYATTIQGYDFYHREVAKIARMRLLAQALEDRALAPAETEGRHE